MKKIISFFKESYQELLKVSWPSKITIVKHTLIVVFSVAVVMLVLTLLDYGLSAGIKLLIESSSK
jgi:preprotein translocase subunit SecE